jgi:hypothetical protein
LIINDGSLAALVASLLAPDLSRVTAWVPPAGSSLRGVGADDAAQVALVSQQSDLLGYERVMTPPALARPVAERWIEQAQSLMLAVAAARQAGCTRVVWPVVCGERIQDMLECSERASLVNRLCWLGEGERAAGEGSGAAPGTAPGAMRLETPFVDLTPGQVGEMARDLDVPLQACWWDVGVTV